VMVLETLTAKQIHRRALGSGRQIAVFKVLLSNERAMGPESSWCRSVSDGLRSL